jgi:ribonuclease R
LSDSEPRRFAALVERRARFRVVEPLFERGPQVALTRSRVQVQPGQIALVEAVQGGVRVVRVLGSPKRPRDVVDALVWDRLGRRGFGRKLEAEAGEAIAEAHTFGPQRRDLRDLRTFTVDPASARDFDDAVSAEPQGDGFRLWIHIADVSAHVRPGSAIDAEALRRANSNYVPGSVEPMLPRVLSDEACSLAPGVERLAVTAEIVLDSDGVSRSTSFYRSLIRSDRRLAYEELDELFAGRAEAPAEIAEPLAVARRAASVLAERRRGSALEIDSREPEFEFDKEGNVVSARGVEQTESHGLIEQLMILTNERVADLLEKRKIPSVYRVHEQPDPARIERMVEQLASLDVPTPAVPKTFSPSEGGEIAAEASRLVAAEAKRRGHGREALTSLVLRSLKPAIYLPRNLGHAGLGSPAYMHFTSPIRRYPDLIAHRALLSAIGAGEDRPDLSEVADAALHCSETERESMKLERTADKLCASFLLERELFSRGWKTKFEGEVSGVIRAGAFVRFGGELGDVYEGFLPARRLRGERFELNEQETAIVGSRTGRAIRLGDPVGVRVEGVEAARGRIDLEPVDDGARGGPSRKPKAAG